MLKSKDINHYFSVSFDTLIENKSTTFDIYLYFKSNQHIILWVKSGTTLSEDFIQIYNAKGIKNVWIHNDEKKLYEEYLKATKEEPEEKKPPVEKVETKEETKKKPKETTTEHTQQKKENSESKIDKKKNKHSEEKDTDKKKKEENNLLADVIYSKELNDEEKNAIAKEAAKDILTESSEQESIEDQKEFDKKASSIVEDILNRSNSPSKDLIEEIWSLADDISEYQHSVSVATYSVLFALAFGKIDPEVLADIALSGLIHDIGVSQIPLEISRTPELELKGNDLTKYTSHVDHTLELIRLYGENISDRAKELVWQHHEKFDGSGYPRKLEGFQFDDIAQLVSMADLLHTIASGNWDGKKCTLSQAFLTLDKLEDAKSFPEFYNPEIFSLVMGWVKSSKAKEKLEQAESMVEEKIDQTLAS